MKKGYNVSIVLIIIALSVWLFFNEKAAEPGALSSSHGGNVTGCNDCHVPWRGPSENNCLHCHDFSNLIDINPKLRFHEAKKLCTECHKEHRGLKADISHMNHTLLNGQLECTQCHLDQHHGMFGRECRECHLISTWRIEGFRHPTEKNRECYRCHRAPYSHYDEYFWDVIEESHYERQKKTEVKTISQEDCWLCHTTDQWGHMKMQHEF